MLSNMIMNRLAIFSVWRKENLSLLINRNLQASSNCELSSSFYHFLVRSSGYFRRYVTSG